jgi:hypothetical protein
LLAFIFTLELVLAFYLAADDETTEGTCTCTDKGAVGVAANCLTCECADTSTDCCTIQATAILTTACA